MPREVDIEVLRIPSYETNRPMRGLLLFNRDILCTTLELPWRSNMRNVSCIPEGLYGCKRTYDRKTTGGLEIPVTFQVTGVDRRDGILFHVGNTAKDTHGCILLGLGFGIIDKQRGILNSKLGFQMFLESLKGVNEFTLRIRSDEYQSQG